MKIFYFIFLSFFISTKITSQPITEILKISADDGTPNNRFGSSVAMSEDYIIVGADKNSLNNTESGAAYIYSKVTVWTQEAKIVASDASANDFFGCSVDIYENYAVVGAYGNSNNLPNAGSAYIFKRIAGVWEEQTKLTASDEISDLWFGYAVAIYGDYVAITARDDNDVNTNSGAVYIFYNNQGNWEEIAKLTEPDGSMTGFGTSVGMHHFYLIVGVPGDDENGLNSGSAYLYNNYEGVWTKDAKLLPDLGYENQCFANDVDVLWYDVFIGCEKDNFYEENGGCVYHYLYFNSWYIADKFRPYDLEVNDNFGSSIDAFDYALIIGAKGSNSSMGSAYVFSDYLGWAERQKLVPSDGTLNDNFGNSVAISNQHAVVGTNNEYNDNPDSAYVFMDVWYVSINTVTNEKISIYPNPSNGIIKIDIENNGMKRISISDITGKKIIEKVEQSQSTTFDLSGFDNGIYFVHIQTEKEKITAKIVKR